MRVLCHGGSKTLDYNREPYIVVGKGEIHPRTGREDRKGD